MTKVLQSTTSTILLLMLLANLLVSSSPVYAISTLNSNINIVWEDDIVKPVVPREEIRRLNLTIEYRVDWGRDFASGALDGYEGVGTAALITLKVTDYSPWCIATLSVTTLLTPITRGVSKSTVFLDVQLKDEAPAFGDGYVKISASANTMQLIGGFEKEFTLEFIAGYLPRINADLPGGTTKNIGPKDSAVFPIELNNLGNARTTVFFEIEDIPKGWNAVINDDITLDENGQFSATLTVIPPRDFGFHDERQSIIIKMTPARAEDLTNIGNPSYVTVVVQSRGFSTPGFEAIAFIGAMAVVLICITLIRKKKK
jgi:hypothetical protein